MNNKDDRESRSFCWLVRLFFFRNVDITMRKVIRLLSETTVGSSDLKKIGVM